MFFRTVGEDGGEDPGGEGGDAGEGIRYDTQLSRDLASCCCSGRCCCLSTSSLNPIELKHDIDNGRRVAELVVDRAMQESLLWLWLFWLGDEDEDRRVNVVVRALVRVGRGSLLPPPHRCCLGRRWWSCHHPQKKRQS